MGHNWSTGQKLRYDLAFLAFQTDLTRVVVSVEAPGEAGEAPGAVLEHHDASHHGKDPAKIEQFARYEEKEYANLSSFLDQLRSSSEAGGSLLDQTQVLIASNLGDASAHAGDNLPVILAGGGFAHRGHVAFDAQRNQALSNLYLRMLQKLGIESERFGMSNSPLSELG